MTDGDRLGNLLGAVALNLATAVDEAVASATGLSASEARALTALANVATGESIDVLRRTVGLSQPGCARLVDRLVEGGYADRERPATDRRVVQVRLTRRGRTMVSRSLAARARVVAAHLDGLSGPDRGHLERVLAHVVGGAIDEPWDANVFCRQCDPVACLHPDRCPATQAARACEDKSPR
jgi:DNA-binding MarR family transcriptional regulator